MGFMKYIVTFCKYICKVLYLVQYGSNFMITSNIR